MNFIFKNSKNPTCNIKSRANPRGPPYHPDVPATLSPPLLPCPPSPCAELEHWGSCGVIARKRGWVVVVNQGLTRD